MANITKGPWNVNTTKRDGAIVRWHIAGVKHGSVYPICEHVIETLPSSDEQMNNAMAISAIPEFVELAELAATLNPNFPEIGEGMLINLVSAALRALNKAGIES